MHGDGVSDQAEANAMPHFQKTITHRHLHSRKSSKQLKATAALNLEIAGIQGLLVVSFN